MSKPHRWVDVLHAIAEGKESQWKWRCVENWHDAVKYPAISPITHPELDWRIKPEPKSDEFVYIGFDGVRAIDAVINPTNIYDWANKIKLTFDGETGQLKSAEVIK